MTHEEHKTIKPGTVLRRLRHLRILNGDDALDTRIEPGDVCMVIAGKPGNWKLVHLRSRTRFLSDIIVSYWELVE